MYKGYHIFNLFALTYEGVLENFKDVESKDNYRFLCCDITYETFINSTPEDLPNFERLLGNGQ